MMKVPVILDTDIGTDIDDTWALAMLLKSPELDVKLVVTDTGDTSYRARIVAKMLEIAGRTDVPVGVGIPLESTPCCQTGWVAGYDLDGYPGPIREDGVGGIVDTVMSAPTPVTLISIGPVPNIAAALRRQPAIGRRARFVGMHGSVRRGYGGQPEIDAEYNVAHFPHACQEVFSAPWDVTITPLDTCGVVRLEGEAYRAVRDCQDPLVQAVIENYRTWAASWEGGERREAETRSSILYDTVAIYLAFSDELLVMEELGIRVTDEGYTVIDDSAKTLKCATDWKDLPAFRSLLVERLTGSG